MKPGRENKPHIGIYGRCNAGKSTLFNLLAGGGHAVVSPHAGTTTDPVRRAFEILDFSPVVLIDTGGLDDDSPLGAERRAKTVETLAQVDLALLVLTEWTKAEHRFAAQLRDNKIPFVLVYNQVEGRHLNDRGQCTLRQHNLPAPLEADLLAGGEEARNAIFDAIRQNLPGEALRTPAMFDGLVAAGETVLLVCPVDSETPSGRLILPQVQAIRELLDRQAVAVVVQPDAIPTALASGLRPKLVVVDSRVITPVETLVAKALASDPGAAPRITSFSILLAQAKGDMPTYLEGLKAIDSLCEGDRILILENCLHQHTCEDIGRVLIPRWLQEYVGKKLDFTVVSGLTPLPADLSPFRLAIQCGGCMVTRRQLQNRIATARQANLPITNYGLLIRTISPK